MPLTKRHSPGQGALLTTHTEFMITFVGTVCEGALTNKLPAGLSLCSSIVPQDGPVSSSLGFSPRPGDVIYQLERVAQTYRNFTFRDTGWSPSEPVMAPGESFWVELGEATTWVRQFAIIPGNSGNYFWVTNYQWAAGSAPGRQPPFIVSNPRSRVADPGSDVSFSVEAAGSPRIGYQWRLGTNEIAHATNATLMLPNVRREERGSYSVMVSNAFGCVTSAVARLVVEQRPALQVQRVGNGVTICWPDSASEYVLEESESLFDGWTDVPATPAVENGTRCLTSPLLSSPRFYRLRGPEMSEQRQR